MANLYKITFKSKSGKLAPLEIYTTASTSEKALDKITNKFWRDEEKYKDILQHFAIFPNDYINTLRTSEQQLQCYYNEKRPQVDYISNNIL